MMHRFFLSAATIVCISACSQSTLLANDSVKVTAPEVYKLAGHSSIGSKSILVVVKITDGADTPYAGYLGTSWDMPRPKVLVTELKIEFGENKNVFVPLSAYSDIANVVNIHLITESKYPRLIFEGGDASESYGVEIEFSELAISSRKLYPLVDPDHPTSTTTYSLIEVGDE